MSNGRIADGRVVVGGFRRRVRMSADTRYGDTEPARRTDRVPFNQLALHIADLPQNAVNK